MPRNPAPAPDDAPAEPVKARWVQPQTVFVPGQGLVGYGDPILVSAEQCASDGHPTIPWSDDWTPDPVLAALVPVDETDPKG